MNACLSMDRNLEESMGGNLYRFSILMSITFHLKKKKKKGINVKGKAKWEELQTTYFSKQQTKQEEVVL